MQEKSLLNQTETRICKTCSIEKSINKFKFSRRKRKDYYGKECKSCRSARERRQKGAKPITDCLPFEVDSELHRICTKCNLTKKLSDFHKCNRVSFGYTSVCKICRSKEYFETEKHPKRRQQDYFPDPQMCQECKVLRPLNKFKTNLRKDGTFGYHNKCGACVSRKHAKLARLKRKIKLANSPELLKIARKKAIEAQMRRRMKKQGVFKVEFTTEDIIKRDGLICYLCLKSLTRKQVNIEHLIPISRGGSHKPENVKISCRSCNSRKINKTLSEYKKWRGDYSRFQTNKMASF